MFLVNAFGVYGSIQKQTSGRTGRGMDVSDRELVSKVRAGDRAAFGELMRRHQQAVYRVAYRLLLNHADAEDAVGEIFLRAYRYLHTFDSEQDFRHWLLAIAVRQSCTARRQRERHPVESLEESIPAPAGSSSPERSYAERELAEQIRRSLGVLPAHQRAAFVLVEVEGLTSPEAGKILGCSAATVRTHLYRAKQRLREELREYLDEEWCGEVMENA